MFVFVYLLKITVILQFSLHVTPHGDIFCIIVPHRSHGATQSPSWFWIFLKVFFISALAVTTLWKCMANEKRCAKYRRDPVSNLIAVWQRISRKKQLSFISHMSWILILWYFLAVVKHLNLLKHIKMHKFYISSLCFHKWPAWKDT